MVERISMGHAGDLKKVSIAIKDRWYVSKEFEYKIIWVDAHGMEVAPEGARWKPIQLTGREIKRYSLWHQIHQQLMLLFI